MRIAPNQLAFFTPESFKDIYQSTGPRTFQKNPLYYAAPINRVHGILTAVGDNHARQRKLLGPGFTSEAVKTQEPLVQDYVNTLMEELSSKSEKEAVCVRDWFNATLFDMTGDLMFGESLGGLSSGSIHPWIALLFDSIKGMLFASLVKAYPALDWLLVKLTSGDLVKIQTDHFALSSVKANKRIELGAIKNDIMSAALRHGFSERHGPHLSDEKVLSRAEIHSISYM